MTTILNDTSSASGKYANMGGMYKSFGREVAGAVMRSVVVILTIIVVIISISALWEVESSISNGSCNIAVLPIEGAILPYHGLADFELIITPEVVEAFMDAAEEEPSIDAVLIEINSPGGTPVASQRIAERFRNSSLPTVGLIGDIGASGGYMVAAASDVLLASPMSNVGSIGVNMSYLEESGKNEEEGVTYVQLTTGQYKDTGTPNRPITEEERDRLQADLEIVHDEFVRIISDYRSMTIEAVEGIADGATVPGSRALEIGLVDSLGGRAEAKGVLAGITGQSPEEIVFCEYRSGFLPF
jgi:protease-4